MPTTDPRDSLIVALDVPSRDEALDLVSLLAKEVGVFKLGLQLFTAHGPRIVQDVLGQGGKVFLDLKLHDIPNTVANAVTEACALGVDLLTLHASGGPKMLSAARSAADEWSRVSKQPAPQLLAVTILTSLDESQVEQIGFSQPIPDLVIRLARLAELSRIDGIVCSPVELGHLSKVSLGNLFFVTPGIRPADSSSDDQSRVQTPRKAIQLGARYIVVGRPIIKAQNPKAAARAIVAEIQAAQGR